MSHIKITQVFVYHIYHLYTQIGVKRYFLYDKELDVIKKAFYFNW